MRVELRGELTDRLEGVLAELGGLIRRSVEHAERVFEELFHERGYRLRAGRGAERLEDGDDVLHHLHGVLPVLLSDRLHLLFEGCGIVHYLHDLLERFADDGLHRVVEGFTGAGGQVRIAERGEHRLEGVGAAGAEEGRDGLHVRFREESAEELLQPFGSRVRRGLFLGLPFLLRFGFALSADVEGHVPAVDPQRAGARARVLIDGDDDAAARAFHFDAPAEDRRAGAAREIARAAALHHDRDGAGTRDRDFVRLLVRLEIIDADGRLVALLRRFSFLGSLLLGGLGLLRVFSGLLQILIGLGCVLRGGRPEEQVDEHDCHLLRREEAVRRRIAQHFEGPRREAEAHAFRHHAGGRDEADGAGERLRAHGAGDELLQLLLELGGEVLEGSFDVARLLFVSLLRDLALRFCFRLRLRLGFAERLLLGLDHLRHARAEVSEREAVRDRDGVDHRMQRPHAFGIAAGEPVALDHRLGSAAEHDGRAERLEICVEVPAGAQDRHRGADVREVDERAHLVARIALREGFRDGFGAALQQLYVVRLDRLRDAQRRAAFGGGQDADDLDEGTEFRQALLERLQLRLFLGREGRGALEHLLKLLLLLVRQGLARLLFGLRRERLEHVLAALQHEALRARQACELLVRFLQGFLHCLRALSRDALVEGFGGPLGEIAETFIRTFGSAFHGGFRLGMHVHLVADLFRDGFVELRIRIEDPACLSVTDREAAERVGGEHGHREEKADSMECKWVSSSCFSFSSADFSAMRWYAWARWSRSPRYALRRLSYSAKAFS